MRMGWGQYYPQPLCCAIRPWSYTPMLDTLTLCEGLPFWKMPARSYTSRRARRGFRTRRRITRRGYRGAIRIRRNPRIFRYNRYIGPGRTLGAFPPRKKVVLRYVQDITLNAADASTAVHVFRGGSLQDPDQSGTGHQPMFHDIYSQIYSKYKVNYSTIRMVALSTHIINTAFGNQVSGSTTSDTQYYASNERACRMFILKDLSTNDYPSNLDTLIEEGSRNLRWRYCPQTTSGRMPSVKNSMTPHKLLNLSKNDDTLNAAVTANPVAEAYYICGVEGLGGTYNPDSMQFQIIMTFNVTYFDLKKNQSEN